MFDVLIKNGFVVNGSGSPACVQDIGIHGDTISAMGMIETDSALEIVEAHGQIVCPGFIDIHAHSDFNLFVQPPGRGKIYQGVTTEVIGNCGVSGAPLLGPALEQRRHSLSNLGIDIIWSSMQEYIELLGHLQLYGNVVPLVGHGNVRGSVLGYKNQRPTAEEMEQMKVLVKEAMDAGAWGLSSGLFYPPGVYAAEEEIISLARVVSAYGGIYATHIRNEEDMVVAAVEEALRIATQAGIPLQISHLKTMGEKNWHKLTHIFMLLEEALAAGVNVSADRYPYTAASTDLDALLPAWACEGGIDAELQRLQQKPERQKIFSHILAGRSDEEVFNNVLISRVFTEANKPLEGKTVAAAAAMLNKSISDAFFDLLVEERLRVGAIFFSMSEENLQKIYQKDYVMVGSDSAVWDIEGPLGDGKPHPRSFGTFPRVLKQYVFEQGVLSLEQAVMKMTGQPAAKLGIKDRGILKEGNKADILIFSEDMLTDRATYENPHQFPFGISHVMVNGRWVICDATLTGIFPGKVILKK
jgi:N-acyl-D-amino-acid deacylase